MIRALLLNLVAWALLSPQYAIAEPVECRADVRATMARAWMETGNGTTPFEAVFYVLEDGTIDYRGTSHEYLKVHLVNMPTGAIVFHTHPRNGVARLSDADKRLAAQHRTFIYAITVEGLFKYSYATGEKKVRENLDWTKPCVVISKP